MRNNLIFLLASFFFASCMLKSPLSVFKSQKEKDKERAQTLIKRNPEFFKIDTVRYIDTIQTVRVEVDTTFKQIPGKTDTIILRKENLRIRYIYKDSLVSLDGECDTIKIYIDKPIKVPVIDPEAIKSCDSIPWWIIFIIVVLGILVLYLLVRKR